MPKAATDQPEAPLESLHYKVIDPKRTFFVYKVYVMASDVLTARQRGARAMTGEEPYTEAFETGLRVKEINTTRPDTESA